MTCTSKGICFLPGSSEKWDKPRRKEILTSIKYNLIKLSTFFRTILLEWQVKTF